MYRQYFYDHPAETFKKQGCTLSILNVFSTFWAKNQHCFVALVDFDISIAD